MSMRIHARIPLAATFAALALAGCGGGGDELPRQHVSGTVTFEGKPLPSGSIQFLPTSQDQATSVGSIITDGRYDIPRDQGPPPGTYKVMIFTTSSGVEVPTEPEPTTEEPPAPGEFVPAKPKKKGSVVLPVRYNYETELTANVEAGGRNVFDYTLTK